MTDDVKDDNEDELKELLDDKDIMEYFLSRDPNRKKADPFLTENSQKEYTGRASSLTKVEKQKDEDNMWGVSYSQHQKHVNDTARNFTWIGISIGIMVAIAITIVFNII